MSEIGTKGLGAATAALFEALLDWFPDIIQSVGADGRIVYVNRKAQELLGYTREQLLGMHLSRLYAPEIWEKVETGFASLRAQGTLDVAESLICDHAGNRIPVEIRSFAVYDDSGAFLRTFSILRDIRETKGLQSQLLHSSRLAAIGELSACVAHDIGNPLAVIRLYLDLMQRQIADLAARHPNGEVDEIAESCATMQRATGKIEKLTQHLREFSRSREARLERVDLRVVIDDALFMVTNKIDKLGVKVERELPDSDCVVQGNASQFEQLFMNLFSNACDAMRDVPAPVLHIALSPVPGDGTRVGGWECQISDNGPGISPDLVEQIFLPFFTTKSKGEGTGLGLSISKQIVLRHQGSITVEAAPGGGALFRLRLPGAPLS